MRVLVALALGLTSALLPVGPTAAALVGDASPLRPVVEHGVLLFRALLLVHAVLLALAVQLRPVVAGPPLVASVVREPGAPSRWEWALLGLILLVAEALRLYGLGHGLWFDEIRTLVTYVRLPVREIVATFDSQNQHMLYSLSARAVVAAVGESAWALRLPAVVFGVASLGALYWFGRLIADRREALLAIAFLAVSYHHIWFSQNARGYTGLMLWTVIASGVFLTSLASGGAGGWRLPLAYGASMALAAYTHITALFVMAAHGLVLAVVLWRQRQAGLRYASVWQPLLGFVLAGTFTLQLYALVLPQLLGVLLEPTMAAVDIEWKDPAWLVAETIRGMAVGVPGGPLMLLLAAVVLGAGGLSYLRQRPVALAVMVLPGVLTAVALLALAHNLWPRFFFSLAGFAVLIVFRGGFSLAELALPARWAPAATAAAALVILATAPLVVRAWGPKQDYLAAGEFIRRSQTDGDAVVTIDMSAVPYAPYAGSGWTEVRTARQLQAIERSHSRTWLVYTFAARLAALQPEIWQRVQTEYRTAAEFPGTVSGGTIVVKVHP
ncbi:MAG: glycosyltransferase family 39 protein [Longimicrobiales bacterium]